MSQGSLFGPPEPPRCFYCQTLLGASPQPHKPGCPFDTTGRTERDKALALVAEKADADGFMGDALKAIRGLPSGTEWTGEDIREALTAAKVTPHHHNAWGAVVNLAVRQGLLVKTGRYVQMQAVSSHARETKVYRRT